MAQIAFDLKIGVEPEGLGSIWFSWAILELAAELGGQPGFRQIGDMRRHPRDREARGGGIGIVIIAVAPIGLGHHGLPPDLVKSDVLRRMRSEERRVGKECVSTCSSRG